MSLSTAGQDTPVLIATSLPHNVKRGVDNSTIGAGGGGEGVRFTRLGFVSQDIENMGLIRSGKAGEEVAAEGED